ncbi:HET-domain-containing protein [Stipitochalara longipes BDJ]|nr:HET-domain-containing protein [Stipitochalara longipes BDJ]
MAMCEECSSFIIHLQQPADRTLFRSTGTCNLCNLIAGTEFNNTKDTITLKTCDPRYYQSYEEKVMTIGGRLNLDNEFSEVTVSISTNFDQTSSRTRTSRISKSPPLHNDESPRSFAIIRKWLATCLTDHTKPRINKFGKIVANTICSVPSATKSRLPTRVLDVGSCESDSVKLVITQNELGDYFALSYCWGRIPDTTWQTTNAIKITREFNVQYLWIDWLCILQDDKDDWLREAARMCDVYENSQLTIAAAGASDSTQGCFVSQRREQKPITVRTNPSEDDERSQQPNCQINFASASLMRGGPSEGPLAKRAWVTQEWYLSKRILFCTIGGYSWKCKALASTERRWGGSNTGPGRNQTWDLGMAVEFGRDRKDHYYFGVWTSDLPELLL